VKKINFKISEIIQSLKIYNILIICTIFFNGCNNTDSYSLSFGVFTDSHYCKCKPNGNRYYDNSIMKLESCIETFNNSDFDFVIQLGDIIDRDFDSFKQVLKVLEKSNVRVYHVLGNADYNVDALHKHQLLDRLSLNKGYYSFTVNNWTFIILNGNDLSYHATSPQQEIKYEEVNKLFMQIRSARLPQAKDWNGGIGKKQFVWLRNNLENAQNNNSNVIIFCHFPLLPITRHSLWNSYEVIKLIETHSCVKAYINGHNHEGNYIFNNGIHYLTIKAMVTTPYENAFAAIKIFDDYIEINGFGREVDRKLLIR